MNKILFVEDERDLSLIVCDILRQQGYDVISVFNGIDGLAKYKAEGADLIVADVMMPGLDGFAMAREIRRLSANVPIIFLTAKSTIDDVEEGFDLPNRSIPIQQIRTATYIPRQRDRTLQY